MNIPRLFVWVIPASLTMIAFHTARASPFKLSSNVLQNGQPIDVSMTYKGLGCFGENRSPELSWDNAPSDTKSFVVSMYDADAKDGKDWHWMLFNIPPNAQRLLAGEAPHDGEVTTRNASGTLGYGGPCPPVGHLHHYVFSVTALNVAHIDADSMAKPEQIAKTIKSHALATSTLTVTYKRIPAPLNSQTIPTGNPNPQ